MKVKLFKIRCHAIGQIMAGKLGLTEKQEARMQELWTRKKTMGAKPLTANMEEELATLAFKKENPELPSGAKAYCETWLKEQIYGKRYTFTSKFTEKGNSVEDEALELIGRHLSMARCKKNDEFFSNYFIEGTPDVNDDYLIDAKAAWDCFTFPLFDDEVPREENYWQGQGYLDIVPGHELIKFVYVLCDTPEKIINGEARRYAMNNGFDTSPEIVEEFRERMTYPGVDEAFKIKVFDVKKNPEDIKNIYERVKMCRAYIDTLVKSQKA